MSRIPSRRRGSNDEVAGRWGLVTGASSGLGIDFARELASRGVHLALVARRQDRLEEVARELRADHGIEVEVRPADLTSSSAREQLHAALSPRSIDILINNAGFGAYGDYLEIDWSREETMLQLDIVALAHLTKLFARGMAARGWGRMLQVASIASYQPTPTYAAYGAAKAFVLQFSEAVSFELEGRGVSSTAISPGITATEFLEVSGQSPTLYQRLMMMQSSTVARIGIRAMLAQKRSVVPGLGNKLGAFSTRVFPRRLATRVAYLTMKDG